MKDDVLAPCGLYCGVCLDNIVNEVCHGCGCGCGACAGDYHSHHCDISQCASSRGFETCAECDEMPCTALINFAYHPFAIHHLPVIENLRRLHKVGKERFLEELRTYFAAQETRLQWAFIEDYGGHRRLEFERWSKERKP
jgi:hypothetical protein